MRNMGGSRAGRGWTLALAATGFVLALVAYAVGAWDSPLLDRERRAQIELLRSHAESGTRNERAERELAETYWTRYADVAKDPVFGRDGTFGLWGAREHYRRHGRREGRHWPRAD